MALWGNNDAVGSGGTVSLDYSTGVVTGSGTTFGNVGAAATGDVIRFGDRHLGVYYGDAVIVSIASTTQLTIGSTAGLSGVAIAGTSFTVSQLPKFTILDYHYSEKNGLNTSFNTILTTEAAEGNPGIPVGFSTVYVNTTTGIHTSVQVGDTLESGSTSLIVTSVGSTAVSLASTLTSGIGTGSVVQFKRVQGGFDSYVYAVSEAGTEATTSTSYKVSHGGWVGVTTYIDGDGNYRVKSETLVAMSGITTGSESNQEFPPNV